MNQIRPIPVSSIDPRSDINVRRLGIDENVEKVKTSIAQHGYWPEFPITVRPHPNPASQYEFQHVSGQCRLKACLELGLEEIPSVVLELSDDEAIQRSWSENEARGELSFSDKAYWTNRIYKRYTGDGHTGQDALQLAANYLGVKINTVIEYFRLSALPDDVLEMLNRALITSKQAQAIVTNTFDISHFEESQQKMKERAAWLQKYDNEGRRFAIEALNKLRHKATIEELMTFVKKRINASKFEIGATIPEGAYDDLLKWGRDRGLEDISIIISHMITETLRMERNNG